MCLAQLAIPVSSITTAKVREDWFQLELSPSRESREQRMTVIESINEKREMAENSSKLTSQVNRICNFYLLLSDPTKPSILKFWSFFQSRTEIEGTKI